MKCFFLLIIFFCPCLFYAQTAWDYSGEVSQSFSGDYLWKLGYTAEINGKVYHKLDFIALIYGVKAQQPGWLDALNQVNDDDSPGIFVRKEGGRVLGNKQGYVEICRSYFSLDSVYLAEAEDSTEFILYDFTLAEGDYYPLRDSVVVSQTATIITLDGVHRRFLRLSNGMELIEGIGVLNAMGTYGFYQQFSFQHEMRCQLKEFYIDGQLVYTPDVLTGIHNVPSTLNSKSSPLNPQPSSLNSQPSSLIRYDLSGRPLSVSSPSSVRSVLPKGVYIEDGKKRVWK